MPGMIGEPVFGLLHGQETVRTPEQEAALHTPSLVTNDSITVNVTTAGPLSDSEARRISNMLAEMIKNDKRKALNQVLVEVA